MNLVKMHYVVEFDIKGFFDNVNHKKLIRQIWTLGIRDKRLIKILKRVLKAPIKMPNGTVVKPDKGTPQGGVISPLLANIVLNELDHWIESQWNENPVVYKYGLRENKNGSVIKSDGYRAMKKTRLKEMYIVRFADDFRIFCRTRNAAERIKIAVEKWLKERLKLELSKEKTRVVNLKRQYAEFLGFKLKLCVDGRKENKKHKPEAKKPVKAEKPKKAKKHKSVNDGIWKLVVESHISDKKLKQVKERLRKQAKRVAKPHYGKTRLEELKLYNSKVMGMHNYYQMATHVSCDFGVLQWIIQKIFYNRMDILRRKELGGKARKLTDVESERYGGSKRLLYEASTKEPIYPIGYVRHKPPMNKERASNPYTPEGRKLIHKNLRVNTKLLNQLMQHPVRGQSVEYNDNRLSMFSAQWGKCAITGEEFGCTGEIHCHHKLPQEYGGTDEYANLILITDQVHRLIHATQEETIRYYLNLLNLDSKKLKKLNELRKLAGTAEIRSESKQGNKAA